MPASPQKIKAPPEGNLAQLLAVLEANTTLLAFFFGLCFVAALLVLAIWFPQPTAFQYTVFRITLALAAAGIAGIIPGMIRLTVKPGTALLIHAGGALAVFVMVYLLAPAPLPMPQKEKPVKSESAPPVSSNADITEGVSSLPPSPPPQPQKEKPVESKTAQPVSSKPDAVEEMPSPAAQEKIIGQYIDNRDGTITDTETGLMWKRCSEGLSGENCEEGKAEEYTWNDAVKLFNNIEYAGYADWRLPTVDELKTLVYCSDGKNCDKNYNRPTINQQSFPNTEYIYWSGTSYPVNSDDAWSVYFFNGYFHLRSRFLAYAVRLVRSGDAKMENNLHQDRKEKEIEEPATASGKIHASTRAAQEKIKIGHYIDNRDGTITDTKTGLMWKRCSEGLSGVNCEEGELKKYTWADAVKRFKNIEHAGYKDWQMPTIDELRTLISCSNGRDKDDRWCNDGSDKPTINQQAFPNTEAWAYWSGSPIADSPGFAWNVYFSNGVSNANLRNYDYAVRLVRGGQ